MIPSRAGAAWFGVEDPAGRYDDRRRPLDSFAVAATKAVRTPMVAPAAAALGESLGRKSKTTERHHHECKSLSQDVLP